MYLVEIDQNLVRVKSSDGFAHKFEIEKMEDFLEENKEADIYVCSQDTSINHEISQKYINVKILDNSVYEAMFGSISESVLKLSPQQLFRGFAVCKMYEDSSIIVNLDKILKVDVFNNGTYATGVIYPSFEMLFNCMNDEGFTQPKLTQVNNEIIQDVANQIGSGIVNGYIGTLKHLIDKQLEAYPWIDIIIFTGSKMENFINFYGIEKLKETLGYNFILESNLIFKGMEYYIEARGE